MLFDNRKTNIRNYIFWGALGIIVIFLLMLIFFVLMYMGNLYDWIGTTEFNGPTSLGPNQPYERGKTLWDFLELIIIPISLIFITHMIGRVAHANEEKRERQLSQDTALHAYLDYMSDLLIERGSGSFSHNSHFLAKVRTHLALRMFDGNYKAIVISFLQDAGLIDHREPIIDLKDANLRGIVLSSSTLKNISLSGADLSDATFSASNFVNVNLHQAKLTNANLSGVFLSDTLLTHTDLEGANFEGSRIDDKTNFFGATVNRATKWPDGFSPKLTEHI